MTDTATDSSNDRRALRDHQLNALRRLIARCRESNPFWGPRLERARVDESIESLDAFSRAMPLLTKAQLSEDQKLNAPHGTNRTEPLDAYTRFCRTSGTTDRPLHWLDTDESWAAMVDVWVEVLKGAGVKPGDRACFTFSFGPFIGFWLAFEAAARHGCLCVPAGGLSSTARLMLLEETGANVLCCTPTYAVRLGQVAQQQGANLATEQIECIIVGGEPGGSVPATRARIQRLYPNARLVDHHGMTEVGPATYSCPDDPTRLILIEPAFYPELIDPDTGRRLGPGDTGELVLTTLHRDAAPVLRYRTGDIVRWAAAETSPCGKPWMQLVGGVIGRADDMVSIRGVNVYPSGVDDIVRSLDRIVEYRVEVTEHHGLNEMTLIIEPDPSCDDTAALCDELAARFNRVLALRVPVKLAEPGSLPRFEMKAKRWMRP